MKISLYTLSSSIHDPSSLESSSNSFLEEIAQSADCEFEAKEENFTDFRGAEMPVIFIRTGGTEGKFKQIFPLVKNTYIRLLTSGMSNSLAASMEILSYLRQHGSQGEILHGSSLYIAQHLKNDYQVELARKKLNGARLGVIGKPSDWLIASDVSRETIRKKLGIELIDIPISELVDEVNEVNMQSLRWNTLLQSQEMQHFNKYAPKKLIQYRDGAFRIYLALENLIEKYQLYGFTLRCFDLLALLHNTGCIALAIFNAKGTPACCEGDIPALLTMCIGQALTGYAGFQANPSRIDIDAHQMIFAHCTMPLNMVKNYTYNTHFESGIGIGLKGEFEEGYVTIAKISGDLNRSWFQPALLIDNLSECNLCRTQIVLQGENFADYFLNIPIGNHHIIFKKNICNLFEKFMQRLQ